MRTIQILFIISTLPFFFSCASSAKKTVEDLAAVEVNKAQAVPSFFQTPPVADTAIYGVGAAKLATLTESRQKSIFFARKDIEKQVQDTINAVIFDYAEDSGVQKSPQLIDFANVVILEISNNIANESRLEELSLTQDGTVYSLLSLSALTEITEDAFNKYKNDAYATFRVTQAMQYLESIMSASPPRAGNIVIQSTEN